MTNREKFEAYAAKRNLNVARKGDGYVSPVTDFDYQAWNAGVASVEVKDES